MSHSMIQSQAPVKHDKPPSNTETSLLLLTGLDFASACYLPTLLTLSFRITKKKGIFPARLCKLINEKGGFFVLLEQNAQKKSEINKQACSAIMHLRLLFEFLISRPMRRKEILKYPFEVTNVKFDIFP